ncbi:MAG TPA: ferritin-like domain-containing protein [Planctomycetota bacterium]|nr:ferritin-like domain-containing protein [Planctomycetota bacterium]
MLRFAILFVGLAPAGCASGPERADTGLTNVLVELSHPRLVRFGNETWALVNATDGSSNIVLGVSMARPGALVPVLVGAESRLPTAVALDQERTFAVGAPALLVDGSGERTATFTEEVLATWNLAKVEPPTTAAPWWRLDVFLASEGRREMNPEGLVPNLGNDYVFTVDANRPVDPQPGPSVFATIGGALEEGGLVVLAIPLVCLAIALSPILIPILLIVDPKIGGPVSCGRPFRRGGRARMACVTEGTEWIANVAPMTSGLAIEDRVELARSWLLEARFEHASIAAFSGLSLDLMALGAPPRLVELAHRAALDEIVHARLCFALASGYEGRAIGPGAFAEARARERRGSERSEIERLAVEALRDGCLNEGFAAALAARALPEAKDEAVRTTLALIARDEARHVELAWSVLEWTLARGAGPAVERLLKAGMPEGPSLESAVPERDALIAHGRLGRARLEELFARVREQVIARARTLLPPRERAPRGEELVAT